MGDLIINLILLNIEVINYRLIYQSINREQIIKPTSKVMFLSIIYASIVAVGMTYVESDMYTVAMHISLLFIVHKVCKRKLYDSFLIYAIMNVVLGLIQFIVSVVTYIPIRNNDLKLILAQFVVLFVVILVCKKLSLYWLLDIAQRVLIGRYLFFTLCGFVFCTLIVANFDYLKVRPNFVFNTLIFAICCYGFYEISKEIVYYTEHVAEKQHDAENEKIRLINAIKRLKEIASESGENVIEEIDSYINSLSLGIKNYGIPIKAQSNIADFIHYKENENAIPKGITVKNNIEKYERNILAPESDIIKMIGILMDNAIEASVNKMPIIVNVYIDMDIVIINIGNECKDGVNFKRVFEKRYSTKNSKGHGYGLHTLKKLVEKKYKGEIIREFVENAEYSCKYVFFKVIIEDCVKKSGL